MNLHSLGRLTTRFYNSAQAFEPGRCNYLNESITEVSNMAADAVIEFTEDNFSSEVLQSDSPVLVDFWAPWCGPCRAIAPMIDQLATDNGTAKIGKLNIDDAPSIAQKYGVASIPTLLVFKNGEVERSFMGGNTSKTALQDALDELA